VAENDRVRIEVGFRAGQSLTIMVRADAVSELESALANGGPDAVLLEAEDGEYTVVVKMVAYVKRHNRESRVGFGAGS
jgi:hypothetical protein